MAAVDQAAFGGDPRTLKKVGRLAFLSAYVGDVQAPDTETWWRYTRIALAMRFHVSPDVVDQWDVQTIFEVTEYLKGTSSARNAHKK
jgi:hypothetical protein